MEDVGGAGELMNIFHPLEKKKKSIFSQDFVSIKLCIEVCKSYIYR